MVRNNNNVETNLARYKQQVALENATSVPCKHTVRTNGRVRNCKNRTKLYPKYCWVHTASTVGLKIKDSNIPGAGKGLFATKNLPEDTEIRYARNKDQLTQAQITRRYNGGNQPYGLCNNIRSDNRCWDALPFRSGLGRWVNDIRGTNREPNSDFLIPRRTRQNPNTKPVVKLDRAVRKGEEILTDYGDAYWQIAEDERHKRRQRDSENRAKNPGKLARKTPQRNRR